MTDQPTPPTLSELIRSVATKDRLRVTAGATTSDLNDALHQAYNDRDRDDQPGYQRLVRNQESSISDLLRKLRDMSDEKEE